MKKYKDAEWMEEEYKNKRRSRESIAEECGVTVRTINDWVTKHGVNRKQPTWEAYTHDEPYMKEEWLEEKLSEGFSKDELAEECSVSRKIITKWMKRYELGDNLLECPNCGEKYYRELGKHWSSRECEYPEITDRQWEIMTGVLMGDGTVQFSEEQNPRFRCDMYEPSKEYLKYLTSEEFPVLMTSVKEGESAEDRAKRHRKSRFNSDAKAENLSTMFYVMTRRLPHLDVFQSWYENGSEWDCGDIHLTPLTLKHYFVADGCWNNSYSSDYISFTLNNQREIIDEAEQLFLDVGFEPTRTGIYERENTTDVEICFGKETSYEMFEYMGESLPGFDYKWPEKYC